MQDPEKLQQSTAIAGDLIAKAAAAEEELKREMEATNSGSIIDYGEEEDTTNPPAGG